ncbi:MAG: ABC transporter ATP-binding protein [Candidatus Hydrogenedentota bacterium]
MSLSEQGIAMIATRAVELIDVSKIFKGRRNLRRPFAKVNDRVAVRKVSFSLGRGELCAISGANGSGKTTLLRLAAGILLPNSGEIRRHARRVNHVASNERQFYERLSGYENLRFFARLAGIDPKVIEPACGMLGLKSADVHEPVWTYSTGMKVRLALARAFVGEPELVLLDEPTRSMDASGCEQVRRAIDTLRAQTGAAILVATHDPELIAVCERYAIMGEGELISTGAVEGIEQARRLRALGMPSPMHSLDRS